MQILRYTGPPVDTHTYLIADEGTGEAWVADAPHDTAEIVLSAARQRNWRVKRIVLTHGHFDHLLDVPRYVAAGLPITACPLDRPLLEVPQPALFGLPIEMPEVPIDEEIGEGDSLNLGPHEWQVWHVPGHSPGHVVLYCADRSTLIGGDLLFQGGYGSVDLPASVPAQMAASRRRLLALPDETRVLPGHGPETTVGAEREWLEAALAAGLL